MSFVDELALRAAEQLETAVGPYIALASYKRLFAAEGWVRDKGVAGALRCAVALDDPQEIQTAATELARLDRSAPSALEHVAPLIKAGRREAAAQVARAELTRTGAALPAYFAALCEPGGAPTEAWGDVARRALEQGASAVLTHATARLMGAWLDRLRRDPEATLPRAQVVELAEKSSLVGASADELLLLARGKLLSASRFQRASALSALEVLARRKDDSNARAALRLVARHVDAMADRLDVIELDRAKACLAHAGAAAPTLAARLDPRAAPAAGESPAGAAYDRLLDGCRELERDDAGSARHRQIDAMTALLSPDMAIPRLAWLAITRVLERDTGPARAAAARFVDRALGRTLCLAPVALTRVADALLAAGALSVAERTLEEAGRVREPAALIRLAHTLRERGYEASARDSRAARALLERAREAFLLAARAPVGEALP